MRGYCPQVMDASLYHLHSSVKTIFQTLLETSELFSLVTTAALRTTVDTAHLSLSLCTAPDACTILPGTTWLQHSTLVKS